MKAPLYRKEFTRHLMARLRRRGGELPYSSPGGGNSVTLDISVYPCHYKTGDSLDACGADKICATCGAPATEESFRFSGDGGRTWTTKFVIRCIGKAHAWPATNIVWRDQAPCAAVMVTVTDPSTRAAAQ